MKILAVDDDDLFLALLGNVLDAAGYGDLTVVSSTDEALGVISEASTPFDCFLLDIRMPGKDGILLCQNIRALPGYTDTPILMLTALVDTTYVDRAFQAGATDYVTKPLNGLELGARMKNAHDLNTQFHRLVDSSKIIEHLKQQIEEITHIDLEDDFSIDKISGFTRYAEVENYLLKLPSAIYAMNIFALKVDGVEMLYQKTSSSQFRYIMRGVAKEIANRLTPEKFILTYVGKGTFGCIRTGRDIHSDARITSFPKHVSLLSQEGNSIRIDLIKGTSIQPSLFSGTAAVVALAKAICNVDTRYKNMEPEFAQSEIRR